ncbi:MAG TPA: N-acetylmuramoyl-L-alanine amidase [Gammaproteobacteria bacterium]|nr:N-acetylmuramoyl-L-alanine amidase [Gammaproteobacteria bacterium]
MRFGLRVPCLGPLLLLAWVIGAEAAQVEGLRVWSGPDSTRVVLDLSAPIDHRIFTLSNPDRIVLDLTHASLSHSLVLPASKGYVKQVRTGKRRGGELRIVFDLTEAVRPKSFLMPPNDQYGHRLVIDLLPENAQETVKRAAAPASPRGRDLVVVIDPGHGGEDPGASGPHGVLEKDVVLAIGLRLAEELKRHAGIRPVLTRNGDYFIELDKRREIAHAAQADLFVSIHADSYHLASVRGATVYVLSERGASDEIARRLAERENASDLVGGVSLADKDPILRQVLLDLSQTAAISASTTVGEHLIERLGSVTPMRKTEVQRARFVVLKQPDIPSILVETAYISNPRQERKLDNPTYQAQIARAIYAGILDYFQANPRPGTYLAMNKTKPIRIPIRYVIGRGDTLSGIADRYNVSLPVLKQSNSLDTDVIQVGQVLTIPEP